MFYLVSCTKLNNLCFCTFGIYILFEVQFQDQITITIKGNHAVRPIP